MNRRKWTNAEKSKIVLSGLKGQSVSSLCNEYGISQLYCPLFRKDFLREYSVDYLLFSMSDYKDGSGRACLVRNGYLPERYIQTGIGSIGVKVPRVRDRGDRGICFHSSLIPPYLRRSKSIEELIPYLYLKGISTGDFSEALSAILGKNALGLSPNTVSRLKMGWKEEMETWQRRSLQTKRYVYLWADGVYLQARQEEKQCMLVLIGADDSGKKEVLAIGDGYRESTESWRDLLLDLKARGLTIAPECAIGDGAMGFWAALHQVYSHTKHQRCWVHKTANILNKLPNKLHERAKSSLHQIWMAETQEDAEEAFNHFIKCYEDKYPKATICLAKDRDVLLTFYQFPAKHWQHIRTTNVIESTFATVKLRTAKTRGCLSRETGLTMVFKLMQSAQKRWIRLSGSNHCAEIIRGIQFKDGKPIEQNKQILKHAA